MDAGIAQIAGLIRVALAGPGPATPALERICGGPVRVRTLERGWRVLTAEEARDLGDQPGMAAWWREGVLELWDGTPLARSSLVLSYSRIPPGTVGLLEDGTPAGTVLPGLRRVLARALDVAGMDGYYGVAVTGRALLEHGGAMCGMAAEVVPVSACEHLARGLALA